MRPGSIPDPNQHPSLFIQKIFTPHCHWPVLSLHLTLNAGDHFLLLPSSFVFQGTTLAWLSSSQTDLPYSVSSVGSLHLLNFLTLQFSKVSPCTSSLSQGISTKLLALGTIYLLITLKSQVYFFSPHLCPELQTCVSTHFAQRFHLDIY